MTVLYDDTGMRGKATLHKRLITKKGLKIPTNKLVNPPKEWEKGVKL